MKNYNRKNSSKRTHSLCMHPQACLQRKTRSACPSTWKKYSACKERMLKKHNNHTKTQARAKMQAHAHLSARRHARACKHMHIYACALTHTLARAYVRFQHAVCAAHACMHTRAPAHTLRRVRRKRPTHACAFGFKPAISIPCLFRFIQRCTFALLYQYLL